MPPFYVETRERERERERETRNVGRWRFPTQLTLTAHSKRVTYRVEQKKWR